MKHLHKILFILLASVLILSGCITEQTQPIPQPNSVVKDGTNTISGKEPSPPPATAKDREQVQPTDSDNQNSQVDGELKVHFIDVGQGAAQLIIGPTGKTMLIDAGNNDKEKLMVEYLQKEKIKRIDIIIGTHPDADHIGGLDAVIDNFDIGKIYMPRIQANTKTFEDVLLAAQRKGLKISTAKSGIVLEWENAVQANMISPIGEYNDTNEMSAVVHITFGETSFLLTGDAESKSEADMVASGINLKADVLLVSHHGSKTSTSQEFLDLVDPTYAVIQSGQDNKYGHPASEVLDRLTNKGIEIYRNDLQGNIIFTSNGKEIKVDNDDWTPNETMQSKVDQPAPNEQESVETQNESKGEITATASISNDSPKQNSTVTVTVTVKDQDGKPVKGAQVDLSLKYKSTTTNYDGVTNESGVASISFKIGRAAKDYKVNGNITVTHSGKTATTKTSFIPQ
ncbi:MBL fold metallo-hydrolase [Paenibacillus residui]|uniref:MBL fold metallo-hydrolase n=1 Tax=Paenibacillus residui TaxID=629724 RepID=A0ABW3D6F8_9BACL